MKTLCAECEYLGDAVFPVVDYHSYDKPRFIGYSDRPNGEVVEHPSRHCNHEKLFGKTLIYEELEYGRTACQYYKKREWERPTNCAECIRKTVTYTNGRFLCSGYPFAEPHTINDVACKNGKTRTGVQTKFI